MAFALLALTFAAMALFLLSLRALATTGVPVRAAPPEAIEAALDLLELRAGERFVDLGCGTGGVLRAARRRAAVDAVGWELNPFAFLAALLRSGGARVRLGDFRRADLSGTRAAYAYLMPRMLAQLAGPLEERLPAGCRLVAIDFPIPGWKPLAVREVGPLRQPVRLYVVGRHR